MKENANNRDYLIEAQPLLTREREHELGLRILEGDTGAVDELALANMPFLISIAGLYARKTGLPVADLINQGYLYGMRRAAEKYDTGKGYRFITFAVWYIRNAIIRHIVGIRSDVRLPEYVDVKIRRLRNKEAGQLAMQNAGLSDEQILALLGRDDANELQQIKQAMSIRVRSLSQPIKDNGSGNGRERFEDLQDSHHPDQETMMGTEELRRNVRLMVESAGLSEREKEVIERLYGLNGRKQRDYDEIAEKMGMKKSKIKEIELQANRKIRKVMGDVISPSDIA